MSAAFGRTGGDRTGKLVGPTPQSIEESKLAYPYPADIANNSDSCSEWDRIIGLLKVENRMKKAYVSTILSYCRAAAIISECHRDIAANGLFYENAHSGRKEANPASRIAAQAQQICDRAIIQLALTPVTGVKLIGANQKVENGERKQLDRNDVISAMMKKRNGGNGSRNSIQGGVGAEVKNIGDHQVSSNTSVLPN